jgi:hypothetical protein
MNTAETILLPIDKELYRLIDQKCIEEQKTLPELLRELLINEIPNQKLNKNTQNKSNFKYQKGTKLKFNVSGKDDILNNKREQNDIIIQIEDSEVSGSDNINDKTIKDSSVKVLEGYSKVYRNKIRKHGVGQEQTQEQFKDNTFKLRDVTSILNFRTKTKIINQNDWDIIE